MIHSLTQTQQRWRLLCALLLAVACDSGSDPTQREVAQPVSTQREEAQPEPTPTGSAASPPVGEPAKDDDSDNNATCDSGDACFAAAIGEVRANRPEAAAQLYERACDLGHGGACHQLGAMYLDGTGVAPDDARAQALFEQGCRQGSTAACDAVGH